MQVEKNNYLALAEKKIRIIHSIAGLLLFLFLPAGGISGLTLPPVFAAASGFTVTDSLGRTVAFDQAPQRIVIAGRASSILADTVYLFPGISNRVVALSRTDQGLGSFLSLLDPHYSDKMHMGVEVSLETVASARPDVILLKSYLAEKLGKPLESLGLKVLYFDMETMEQFPRDLRTLGQLFQNDKRAEYIIDFFRRRTDRITRATAGIAKDRRPGVLVLSYNDRDGQIAFRLPPLAWIQTQMVQMAGGRPLWKDAQTGGGWTKVSLEQIAAWDADRIFLIAYAGDAGAVVRGLKTNPQWRELRAVKQGGLYAFPSDYMSWDQPDPRWILGFSWLAAKMHPELFPGWDMEKETQAFFRELYGLDADIYRSKIKPVLKGDLP